MRYRILITSVFVFALSFWILSRNISDPFTGIHDHNGARFGNIAKNYLKYGQETRLGQVEQKNSDGSFEYYTHYPPLLSLSIAASYGIFGASEGTTRIIPVFATSFTMALLFLIGYILWGWRVGIFASFLALATPMVRYFGANPVHETLVTFFASIVFLGLALVVKNKNQKLGYWLVFTGSVLAALSGWGGYFVAPATILIFWKLKTDRKIIIFYLSILLALFLGHFIFVRYLTGSFLGGELGGAFLYRSGHTLQEFGVLKLLSQLRLWASTLFTVSLLLTASSWIFFWRKYRNRSVWLIPGMFIFGALYPLIFSNAAYVHNYFIFGLLPVLAICGSLATFSFLARLKKPLFISPLRIPRLSTGENEAGKKEADFQKEIPPFQGRIGFILIPVIVLFLVAFERQTFLEALENSKTEELAYEIGTTIKDQTDKDDVILISPSTFLFSRKTFLSYYGERTLVASESDQKYTWRVLVDEPTRSFRLFRENTK